MSNKTKIAIWRARQRLLATRGLQNNHIIAKLERRIRAAEKQEE